MSVKAYLGGVVAEEDLSGFFTSELMAEIETIDREMDQEGGTRTSEEVWAGLEAH